MLIYKGGGQTDRKIYAVYSRKSRFTGQGESVENQVNICRQYICSRFGKYAAENILVYEDEGFSGGSLNRPAFQKMMNDSRQLDFAAVVVYRLDRISRNIGDFAELIEELGRRNIDFISVKEQFDTSSPMGRAMMYIASVFSQLERETIAERIRDNMHELAKTGRWLGGITPLGYISQCIVEKDSSGKDRKSFGLICNEKEADTVRLIFRKYEETASLTKTEAFLKDAGYTTRRNRDFTRFAIKSILSNPVYMKNDSDAFELLLRMGVCLCSDKSSFDGHRGVMVYNRTLQRPGKTNIINPPEMWIAACGTHKGIVSGSQWNRINMMLRENAVKIGSKARRSSALLSGIIFCGKCGSPMRVKLTGTCSESGEPRFSYICTLKEKSHGKLCHAQNVRGNSLDCQVSKIIDSLPCDENRLSRRVQSVRKNLDSEKKKDSLQRNIRDKEAEIKTLAASLASVSDDSKPYIAEQIDLLSLQAEALKSELSRLESASEIQRPDYTGIDLLSPPMRHNAALSLIDKVVCDGENADIYLKDTK